MAVNINRSFMNNTDLTEQTCLNKLLQNMSPELENETETIHHSMYYSDTDFRNVLHQQTKNDIIILNLNCLNLKTRFDKLKLFLADIDRNSEISCITLQGTCFDENTDLDFYSLPGYTLISEAYRISSHCGIAIYIHDNFSHERKFTTTISPVFENISIEICRKVSLGTKYLICSVYRPPTGLVEDLTMFIEDFGHLLENVHHTYRKAYICGDMNINLLKINENIHYDAFYENVTAHGFMPQITLPTRLSDTCDTLIDNIFTNNFEKQHTNCILTRIISDHQMICCILNGNIIKKSSNVFIEVENINEHSLGNFKNDLIKNNIYETLNKNMHSDPNENYEILAKFVTEAKEKNMPKQVRRFNKRKDKKEKWMINELLSEINIKK